MNYTHITREERYQIYALKKAGHKQYEIAEVLNRNESTISRELARNSGRRGYRPKQAHSKTVERQAINARTIDDATWQFAQDRLMEHGALGVTVSGLALAHTLCYCFVHGTAFKN